MRGLLDIVENMTGAFRLVIGIIALLGFLFWLTTLASISVIAPKVAKDYGERAERLGESAIAAAREEARARELGEDGWGYESSRGTESSSSSSSRRSSTDEAGGWGEGAQ